MASPSLAAAASSPALLLDQRPHPASPTPVLSSAAAATAAAPHARRKRPHSSSARPRWLTVLGVAVLLYLGYLAWRWAHPPPPPAASLARALRMVQLQLRMVGAAWGDLLVLLEEKAASLARALRTLAGALRMVQLQLRMVGAAWGDLELLEEKLLALDRGGSPPRDLRLWLRAGLLDQYFFFFVNLIYTVAYTVDFFLEGPKSSAAQRKKPMPNRRFKRTITSWRKVEHIGSGSFGLVYKAISDDGFFFAVKEALLLHQGLNAKQQLEHEISLLSRLEHENIVQYFGTDKKDGKLYIFLELVTQGSLATLYQKCRLQDSQVSAYTRQILNGLNFLHQRNVVHRDIKCANILVAARGLVKLADFGLAKEISILNQARSCKGTVRWMAPEVAKAEPHGPPADIWSLGCTVLEMLTRKVPYPDMEVPGLKIGRGEPPEIPNTLSEDARDFIKRCVQANPNDRPSAAQLLEHPFVQRPLQH